MKRLFYLLIVLLTLGGLSGCSTDVEINGDWKNITVVYGMVNQYDTEVYVKVNKAFLGEGNALIMAQQPDSLQYHNKLKVTLENFNTREKLVLDTTTIYNKEEGVFYAPEQIVYHAVVPEGFWGVEAQNEIHLSVEGIGSKVIKSKSTLLKTVRIKRPALPTHKFKLDKDNETEIKWEMPPAIGDFAYGKRFRPVVHFYYDEVKTDKDTLHQVFSYTMPELKVDASSTAALVTSLNGQGFFELYKKSLKDSGPGYEVAHRLPKKMVMEIWAGDKEYALYKEVNGVSSTVNQERPEYTNIEGGYGLFASRCVTTGVYSEVVFSPATAIMLIKDCLFKANR